MGGKAVILVLFLFFSLVCVQQLDVDSYLKYTLKYQKQYDDIGGGEGRAFRTSGSASPESQQQTKMDTTQPPRHAANPNPCLPDLIHHWASTDTAGLETKHQVSEAIKAGS